MKPDDTIMSEGEPSNESDADNEELQPSPIIDDGLNTSLSGKFYILCWAHYFFLPSQLK